MKQRIAIGLFLFAILFIAVACKTPCGCGNWLRFYMKNIWKKIFFSDKKS